MDIAPTLCPTATMLPGSPPKAPILSRTPSRVSKVDFSVIAVLTFEGSALISQPSVGLLGSDQCFVGGVTEYYANRQYLPTYSQLEIERLASQSIIDSNINYRLAIGGSLTD